MDEDDIAIRGADAAARVEDPDARSCVPSPSRERTTGSECWSPAQAAAGDDSIH